MRRALQVCLVIALAGVHLQLQAQQSIAPANLEVNLGALQVDWYDGCTNNDGSNPCINQSPQGDPVIQDDPACAAGTVYRQCIQWELTSYAAQGVVGVRFQFGMNGCCNWSTPFLDNPDHKAPKAGNLNPTWLNNLQLFFQDLRAANIRYVTFTPDMNGGFGGENEAMWFCNPGPNQTNCFDGPPDIVYYPWLPFGVEPGGSLPYGQNGVFGDPGGYTNDPHLTNSQGAWGWLSGSPFIALFDSILWEASEAQLIVREVDLIPESTFSWYPVLGRLIFDQTTTDGDGNPYWIPVLQVLGDEMTKFGFNNTVVTMSTAASNPETDSHGNPLADCTTGYPAIYNPNYSGQNNSALVIDADEFLSAELGGPFGVPELSGNNTGDNRECSAYFQIPQYLPTQLVTSISDIHTYPATCPQPGFCSPQVQTDELGAKTIYGDIAAFIANNKAACNSNSPSSCNLGSNTVMIGETDPDSPDGTGTFTVASANNNVAGFVNSGLASPTLNVILRPWEKLGDSSIGKPASLSIGAGAYVVAGCAYDEPIPTLNVPASGAPESLYVYASQSCQWSTAPTPSAGSNPQFPSWFTLTTAPWQTGSQWVGFQVAQNYNIAQRVLAVTMAGQPVTIIQGGYLAPPASLNPTYGQTNVPQDQTLSWSGSVNATAYQVYFGTSPSPPLVATQPGTSYAPAQLAPSTTYYWHVTATDSFFDAADSGTAQFTTQASDPAAGLDFYPVTPCRVADSSVGAGQTLPFAVLSSPCGIPGTAAAYSFNITAIPEQGYLGALTTWPTGQSTPNVSTLNSYNGSAIANAAIVPAGTSGEINVLVTQETEVQLDINGYFAPPLSYGLEFYAVTPCRIADTRTGAGFTGAFGPPSLVADATRTFPVPSSSCGIPSTALAYSLNFTAIPPGALQELIAWPTSPTMPNVSMLSDPTGAVLADAAIVGAGTSGGINVYPHAATDMLFDVNGYFAAPSSQGLHFYPVTPCRVADTRSGAGFSGAFSPPSLVGQGTARSFPIPSSSCGIPTTAAAYSLNFTVVPQGPLGNLTTWPTGQSMPNVSTLNDSAGIVLANAAIVPAGTGGAISVWVTDSTDMCLDINGYFAP